jgi:hypothetical protein
MARGTFDEVLDLEEQFYEEGFQQGLTDGVKAGRTEGRTFGLEKGFEKYVESSRLYGKSLIWANCIPKSPNPIVNNKGIAQDTIIQAATTENAAPHSGLKTLPANQRLAKHIKVLHALTESESLSTENTEDAVSDFDDRYKRAQAKAKVIEKLLGDVKGESGGQ